MTRLLHINGHNATSAATQCVSLIKSKKKKITSLFGNLLQIILQFSQVLLQILTATHIEELLLVVS